MNLKKLSWLTLGCLIVFTLVLASCTPAATQTTAPTAVKGTVTNPTTAANPTTSIKPVTPVTTSGSDVPKYGGVATVILQNDVSYFDDAFAVKTNIFSLNLTNEELFQGDWTRGLAGTKEVSFTGNFQGMEKYTKTGLAQSWEMNSTDNSVTFHLRDGVNFQNKAPTNGRALNANDVVTTATRNWATPSSFLKGNFPKPASITATDSKTVVFKYAVFSDLAQTVFQIGNEMAIFPADAAAQFGDFRDWKNSIGTGPFMMTDYVKNSSITFVRNPGYWDKDPIGAGKGNQLPYLDGVKLLIIPDVSTQMAAMRTGKADQDQLAWDMAASLKKTNPEIQFQKIWVTSPYGMELRMDNPQAPWYNLKVRQAMLMAVDHQAVVDSYYGGDAYWYTYPVAYRDEYKDMITPFAQLPADVQELYSYKPDKAKQMISDAGYPNGFDVSVVCQSIYVDLLSIYKNYWAKVGINLTLDVKEQAVYLSMQTGRTYKDSIYRSTIASWPFNFDAVRDPKTSIFNGSMIFDAKCIQAHDDIWNNYTDWNKQCQLVKDIAPYIMRNAWLIPMPEFPSYSSWQPWLKNYHGEYALNNTGHPNWLKWSWIDQDLKAQKLAAK